MRRKGYGTVTGILLPAAVLTGILLFCLWNGHAVGTQTARWEADADAVSELVRAEAWEAAADRLSESYARWRAARPWLQMVSRHSAEDEAEDLYRRCLVLVESRAKPELLSDLAGLRACLEGIAEMERMTRGNLL